MKKMGLLGMFFGIGIYFLGLYSFYLQPLNSSSFVECVITSLSGGVVFYSGVRVYNYVEKKGEIKK